MDKKEQQEILRIATEYFRKETGGDEKKAQRLLQGLAALVQRDGVNMVHIENTLFLVIVKGKGIVEVHTLAIDESSATLAKNFVSLTKYLKNIGVKVAYTYSDDPRYAVVAKRTKLDFQEKKITAQDGKTYTAYYLEL